MGSNGGPWEPEIACFNGQKPIASFIVEGKSMRKSFYRFKEVWHYDFPRTLLTKAWEAEKLIAPSNANLVFTTSLQRV